MDTETDADSADGQSAVQPTNPDEFAAALRNIEPCSPRLMAFQGCLLLARFAGPHSNAGLDAILAAASLARGLEGYETEDHAHRAARATLARLVAGMVATNPYSTSLALALSYLAKGLTEAERRPTQPSQPAPRASEGS